MADRISLRKSRSSELKGEKETDNGNPEWGNEDLRATQSIKDTEDTSDHASYSQEEEDEEEYNDKAYIGDYYDEDDDDGESTTEARVDAEEDKEAPNADAGRIDTSRGNGGRHNERQNPEMNEIKGENSEQGEMEAEGGEHGKLQAEGEPERKGLMAGAGDGVGGEDDRPPRGNFPHSDLTFSGFYSVNETVGGKPVVKVSWRVN